MLKITTLCLFWATMSGITFPNHMYNGGELNPITITEISLKTESSLKDMVKLLNAECPHEPLEGQKEVFGVVMARTFHNKFPSTMREVIFQGGQFDGVGTKYFKYSDEMYKKVKEWYLERYVSKYLFFYNPCSSTDNKFIKWVTRKYPNTYFIQNHIFHGVNNPPK